MSAGFDVHANAVRQQQDEEIKRLKAELAALQSAPSDSEIERTVQAVWDAVAPPVFMEAMENLESLLRRQSLVIEGMKKRASDFSGTALADVANERLRQVEELDWSAAHDDEHSDGSLAQAAACYAVPTTMHTKGRYEWTPGDSREDGHWNVPQLWPDSWHPVWWKPKDQRFNLVRAAALLVAEIERLDRLTPEKTKDQSAALLPKSKQ